MTIGIIFHALFMTVYTLSLLVVCIFGFHRWMLLMLFMKNRRRNHLPSGSFDEYPAVTVQLPMYNEPEVAARVIQHACRLDWPADKLEIQVLDDSTDRTCEIARLAVETARQQGINIHYIHRDNRSGYKAGALAEALKVATGEFITIFDADFMPEPDTLKRSINFFTDPDVCLVQARWEHLNRDSSLLTQGQAVFLDGHFVIEHVARNRSGRFMSFNGTAGTWRREAIEDAGGWHHDTLTEDMDLSYRAQLKGWKIIYLPELTSPAELPDNMNAFKSQQHRWTKGGTQTAIKLLPRIWLSDAPLKAKIEATFHLTSFSVHLFIVLLMLMLYPAMLIQSVPIESGTVWRSVFDLSVFGLATLSAGAFYLCGQATLFGTWLKTLLYLPFLMALGVGISISNAKAALEAIVGHKSEFVCTPKTGGNSRESATIRQRFKSLGSLPVGAMELTMALYLGVCAFNAFSDPRYMMGGAFLAQFAIGFLYVASQSLGLGLKKA